MLTDTLPWFAQAKPDSPWRRLHWTLPLALLICSAAFILFAYSMWRPVNHTSDPTPVTAELIELPVTAQPQPPTRQVPIEQPSENPAPIAPPPPPAAPVATPPADNPPALSEIRGAQAIVQPLPVIPDELRQDAMKETATARFHIAVDGSVTVELIKPTQNPRLNRLLLDTLKNWKFFPAMKEGKPVASIENIVIRVQVK
jgi:TonB family protein